MKILLFGEFSGFMNSLKSGLTQLGQDVFLASNGDGFKNFPSDFRWDIGNKIPNPFRLFLVLINVYLHRHLLRGYDVVLFISPNLFGKRPIFNRPIYNYILKNNTLVYLVGAGLYNTSFKYWYDRKDSKYFGYTSAYIKECKSKREMSNYFNKAGIQWEKELLLHITGIIPIWYEYAEPYRNYPNLKKAIRTPVDLEKFEYKPNEVKDGKVVFFHGLSRPCKGGKFILAAFDRLRDKHKDDAEFIAAGGLPFDEYMKIIDRTNVIVDDANSYSFCMNAFFSMLKGKVVMGGAEPEGNTELEYEDVPVINICANVDQICKAIENLIDRKNDIKELGLKSRKFVEKYHNSVDVAKTYISQFESDFKALDHNN